MADKQTPQPALVSEVRTYTVGQTVVSDWLTGKTDFRVVSVKLEDGRVRFVLATGQEKSPEESQQVAEPAGPGPQPSPPPPSTNRRRRTETFSPGGRE